MPARPRIKTVTYSKESKKAPGYSWKPGNYAPLRIGCICPNKKVLILPSVLFGGGSGDLGIPLFSSGPGGVDQTLVGGVPDGLFILGGTPRSDGPVISGNGPGSSGSDLPGGIPGSSFMVGGTPTTSGPVISGNGPGSSGTNLSGGNI